MNVIRKVWRLVKDHREDRRTIASVRASLNELDSLRNPPRYVPSGKVTPVKEAEEGHEP